MNRVPGRYRIRFAAARRSEARRRERDGIETGERLSRMLRASGAGETVYLGLFTGDGPAPEIEIER